VLLDLKPKRDEYITTDHYYGGYLDDAIDMALNAVRKNRQGVAMYPQATPLN